MPAAGAPTTNQRDSPGSSALLLVLAAAATSAALLTGSLRQLLLAGVWVGLAFQAKMIQAWLALPALAAAYLLAAPAARLGLIRPSKFRFGCHGRTVAAKRSSFPVRVSFHTRWKAPALLAMPCQSPIHLRL